MEMTIEQQKAEKRKILMLNPKNSPKWLRDTVNAGKSLEKLRKAQRAGNQKDTQKYFASHIKQLMDNGKRHYEDYIPEVKTPLDHTHTKRELAHKSIPPKTNFCICCENELFEAEVERGLCIHCQINIKAIRWAWIPREFKNAIDHYKDEKK